MGTAADLLHDYLAAGLAGADGDLLDRYAPEFVAVRIDASGQVARTPRETLVDGLRQLWAGGGTLPPSDDVVVLDESVSLTTARVVFSRTKAGRRLTYVFDFDVTTGPARLTRELSVDCGPA